MRSLRVVGIAILVGYAASGVYFVQPDEQAVVRRFGSASGRLAEPGPHWGLPWPFDRVDRVRTREVRQVSVGRPDSTAGVIATGATQFLTGDRNLVNLQATVQFTIADPKTFLFTSERVEPIIAAAAEAAIARVVATEAVDAALTLGKRDLGVRVDAALSEIEEIADLGVTIRSVDVATVEPPPEVADAFNEVVSALRQREQAVNEAHSYADRARADAAGQAQTERDQAAAYGDRAVLEARGESDRFARMLAEYRLAPRLTATRLYLDALGEVLPRLKSKLIVGAADGLDVSILRGDAAPQNLDGAPAP